MDSNKNAAVIEFLLNQLRQQLTNNPYKQQCEDLAHEVLSLKNQLRDASALVAELREDNIKKSEHISHLTGQTSAYRNDALRLQAQVEDLVSRNVELQETITLMNEDFKRTTANPEYREELSQHYKDMMSVGEQSGCRKEDTQECPHSFYYVVTDGSAPFGTKVCKTCKRYF